MICLGHLLVSFNDCHSCNDARSIVQKKRTCVGVFVCLWGREVLFSGASCDVLDRVVSFVYYDNLLYSTITAIIVIAQSLRDNVSHSLLSAHSDCFICTEPQNAFFWPNLRCKATEQVSRYLVEFLAQKRKRKWFQPGTVRFVVLVGGCCVLYLFLLFCTGLKSLHSCNFQISSIGCKDCHYRTKTINACTDPNLQLQTELPSNLDIAFRNRSEWQRRWILRQGNYFFFTRDSTF